MTTEKLNGPEAMIWAVLRHRDRKAALSGKALAYLCSCDRRKVRDYIKSMRRKGYAVASSFARGYWGDVSRQDAIAVTEQFKSHALAELEIVALLKKQKLHDVAGQMIFAILDLEHQRKGGEVDSTLERDRRKFRTLVTMIGELKGSEHFQQLREEEGKVLEVELMSTRSVREIKDHLAALQSLLPAG